MVRQRRSIKTLARYAPLPSMLILISRTVSILMNSVEGNQGGFNRSSQHPDFGGADDNRQTEVGAIDAAQIVLAGSTASLAA